MIIISEPSVEATIELEGHKGSIKGSGDKGGVDVPNAIRLGGQRLELRRCYGC